MIEWIMDNTMKILAVFLSIFVIGLILFSVDYFVRIPAPSVSAVVADKLSSSGQDPHTSVGLVMNTGNNGGVSPVIMTGGGSDPRWQFVVKLNGKYETVDTTETEYYSTNIGDTITLNCYYGVIAHDYNCTAGG